MFMRFFRGRRGFTLVETLLTVAIFAMVIVMYMSYMSTQNREVLTVIQKNEANDESNLILQYVSNDVKSAKRTKVTISSDGSGIAMDRFVTQTDDKKSIQLALERVDYKYDRAARTITRTAAKYDQGSYDAASDSFKAQPAKYDTRTFKNVSIITFTRIPMPAIKGVDKVSSHMLGVDIKLVVEIPNVLTKTPQKSSKETSYFIRDEVNFKNDPFWNANPKTGKTGPLSVQFSDPLKINLSQNEFKQWIDSLKTDANVNLGLSEINNKMMIALSNMALEKLNDCYSEFMSDLQGSIMKKARESFVDYVKQSMGGDKQKLTMAILLKNYILGKGPGDCQRLKDKIMSGGFSDDDIRRFVKESESDLKKYGIASSSQIAALTGASTEEVDSASQLIGNIKANIDASKGSLQDFVFKYVENTAISFSQDIKKKMWDKIGGDDCINKTINNYVDAAVDNVMEQAGVNELSKNADSDGDYDAVMKAVIKSATGELSGWLKNNIKSKVGDLAQKIKDTVKNKVDSGMGDVSTQDEALARQKEHSLSSDIGNSVSDIYGSVMVTISKNLLLGNKWDSAGKQFVAGGGKDYLNSAFGDFGLSPSSLSENQQNAVKNDDQVRQVKEIMNKK